MLDYQVAFSPVYYGDCVLNMVGLERMLDYRGVTVCTVRSLSMAVHSIG